MSETPFLPEDVEEVMSFTGCTRDEAIDAITTYGSPLKAMLELTPEPPKKHKWDSNLTEEQRIMCQRGRDLQDKVNGVFSVAHSKVKSLHSEPALEEPRTVDSGVVAKTE